MGKLTKNSNAMLGILCVVLATYTEAHAGSAAFQLQRVQNAYALDSRGGANATSQRLANNCAAFLRAKGRQQVQPAIAGVSDSAFKHTLLFAGLAQGFVAPTECAADRRLASARAPPLSWSA